MRVHSALVAVKPRAVAYTNFIEDPVIRGYRLNAFV